MTDSGSSGFSLNAEENGFNNRCKDVFAGLASLEKKHDAFTSVQSRNRSVEERSHLVKPDPREEPVQPQSKGSFRNPRGRPKRSRYNCGFKRNPEKWTPYDLSTVSKDQLSDKGNTAAALQFLQERRKSKDSTEDQTPADLTKRVEFSHRSQSDIQIKPESSGKRFRDGKLVMPEYDIGNKNIKKEKKRKIIGSGEVIAASSVSLSYDDDAEEDGTMDQKKKKEVLESVDEPKVVINLPSISDVASEDNMSKQHIKGEHSEVKFRKVSGKRGIRQRRQKDDEEEDN